MVEQNKKRTSSGTPASAKRWRLVIALVVIPILAIGGIVWGCWELKGIWFTENRHLVLRKVKVLSSGYWSGRDDKLADRLQLKRGTEMFRINPAEVRQALEKIPCVAKAEVRRELPDTLLIKLTERVPRAVIGSRSSPFVVDENGVLILRGESMAAGGMDLPVITGIATAGLLPGGSVGAAKPALKLIMLAMHEFPIYHIAIVSMPRDRRRKSLECYLSYRTYRTMYRVTIPIEHPDPAMLLRMLEQSIIEVRRSGNRHLNFNLNFDGQVVLDKP